MSEESELFGLYDEMHNKVRLRGHASSSRSGVPEGFSVLRVSSSIAYGLSLPKQLLRDNYRDCDLQPDERADSHFALQDKLVPAGSSKIRKPRK